MPSVYDIASSAVRAQKENLSNTSQNIANVDTDGYVRREVKLDEVSAKNDGLAAKGASVGLGVKVDQVRRAYDEVLSTQLRNIGANFQSAQAFVSNLEKLENYLLPDGNLIDSINLFFSSLSNVAAEPASQANRVTAISHGNEVASAFSRTRESLGFLEAQIHQEIDFTVDRVNQISKQLAKVNSDISASFSSKGATPSLLDIRDKLLVDLGEIIAVSVTHKETGEVQVDLGFDGNGATLVNGKRNFLLSHKIADNETLFFINATQPLTGFDAGLLRGISDSQDVLNKTEKELDILARRFTKELNDQHVQGIDLNGNSGTPLFSSSSHELVGIPENSEYSIEVEKKSGHSDKYENITFTYNERSDHWTAYHQGKTLVSARKELNFDGFNIKINGPVRDGAGFMLSRSMGDAQNINFLIKDPKMLAATSSLIVEAAAKNTGTAVAKVGIKNNGEMTRPKTFESFKNNLSPLASKVFLKSGTISEIPRGVSEIQISSNAEQSAVIVSSAKIEKISRLELNIGGQVYTLNIPTGGNDLNIQNSEQIAEYLNTGLLRFVDSGGQSLELATVGGFANGFGDTLKIVSSSKNISAGVTVVDGVSVSGVTSSPVSASNIQIFTKEGRHIAGTALSAAEINTYINEENGFSEFATYRADFLNQSGSKGYRGVTSETISATSGHSLTFGILGGGTGIGTTNLVNSQTGPNNFFDQQTLTFSSTALGIDEAVKVPANSSADTVAKVLNTKLASKGLYFEASNRVQIEMASLSSNPVSFQLSGTNAEPISVKGEYNTTVGFTNLASAINAVSPTTGVFAEVNSNSERLVLSRSDGGDIRITNVTNANINLSALNNNYSVVGSVKPLTPSTANGLVFSGLITGYSKDSISVTSTQGTAINSSSDKYQSASVSRDLFEGGDKAVFGINALSILHGNASESSVGSTFHGDHKFTLKLTKEDGTVHNSVINSGSLSSGGAEEVVKALVSDIKRETPIPKIESASFPSLPPENARMKFIYGGEKYQLRYSNSEFQVSGLDSGQFIIGLNQSGSNYSLSISVPRGSNSGSSIIPIENDGEDQFGFTSWTNSLTGSTTKSMNIGDTHSTIVQISESATATVTLERLANGTYRLSSNNASVIPSFADGNTTSASLTKITIKNNNTNTAIEVNGSTGATAMGFAVGREEIFSDTDNNRVVVRAQNGAPVNLEISGHKEQNNNSVHLKDIPDEELILLLSGGGARKVSMDYILGSLSPELPIKNNIEISLIDAETKQLGVFDNNTGSLIAERKFNEGNAINILDYSITISGKMEEDDSFTITTNDDLKLNGKNLDLVAQLGISLGNRQNYQDSYRDYLIDVGSKLTSNRIKLDSVTAQLESAKQKVDEKSGVNLDTEAANLIQQQQSYQAAARLLQTARDMFETIVKI